MTDLPTPITKAARAYCDASGMDLDDCLALARERYERRRERLARPDLGVRLELVMLETERYRRGVEGYYEAGSPRWYDAVVVTREGGATGWVERNFGTCKRVLHTHVEVGDDGDGGHVMRCAELLRPKVEATRRYVETLRGGDE
ncbi:MAG: hypothetical protein ACLFVJ_22640 [Persicimonas sp.]